MQLRFHGAADGVTGSLHRLTVGESDVILDCGLFQGRREESNQRNRDLPRWTRDAAAVVLSHAHLDHSGSLPTLAKRGFEGNIFCTPPTRDLCSVMLRDAAMIQEADARHLNKRFQREGIKDRIEPLYSMEDVQAAMQLMISVPLHRPMPVVPGMTLTFHNAGHVLGSALVQLDLQERGRRSRLLFSGDLGRAELPLLRDPEIPEGIETLLLESTYGNRLHADFATVDDRLGEIVKATIGRGGRVFIPTFALERAQEVLFSLERLFERDALPRVPVYIDSPLAIKITEIYKLHPEGLDGPVRERMLNHNDPFSPPGLRYVTEARDSKALQASGEPCIVIAGSGMCEGGRILHHFVSGLEDSRNSVVLVGFMAEHTLGRRIGEGRRQVKVFGVEREVNARVHVLDGLSAHGDREDLLGFVRAVKAAGPLRRVVLVHGEDDARTALKQGLKELGVPEVIVARPDLVLEL